VRMTPWATAGCAGTATCLMRCCGGRRSTAPSSPRNRCIAGISSSSAMLTRRLAPLWSWSTSKSMTSASRAGSSASFWRMMIIGHWPVRSWSRNVLARNTRGPRSSSSLIAPVIGSAPGSNDQYKKSLSCAAVTLAHAPSNATAAQTRLLAPITIPPSGHPSSMYARAAGVCRVHRAREPRRWSGVYGHPTSNASKYARKSNTVSFPS